MTKCCKVARFLIWIRSVTASGQTIYNCRSTARKNTRRQISATDKSAYHVNGIEVGENPHINYEPSSKGGLAEKPKPEGVVDRRTSVSGHVSRQPITRTLKFKQRANVIGHLKIGNATN